MLADDAERLLPGRAAPLPTLVPCSPRRVNTNPACSNSARVIRGVGQRTSTTETHGYRGAASRLRPLPKHTIGNLDVGFVIVGSQPDSTFPATWEPRTCGRERRQSCGGLAVAGDDNLFAVARSLYDLGEMGLGVARTVRSSAREVAEGPAGTTSVGAVAAEGRDARGAVQETAASGDDAATSAAAIVAQALARRLRGSISTAQALARRLPREISWLQALARQLPQQIS